MLTAAVGRDALLGQGIHGLRGVDLDALARQHLAHAEAEDLHEAAHRFDIQVAEPRFPKLKILVMYECLRLLA